MKRYQQKWAILGLSLLVLLGGTSQASASCAVCSDYENALRNEINDTHRTWMTNEWWNGQILPGLKSMTTEIRNAALFEAAAFGAFLDGQNANSAARAILEMQTVTLRNYTMSDSICKFGTLSKSLAYSQQKGKSNQLVLSERSRARQLGEMNTAAADGESSDRIARLKQFQTDYCDPSDFGSGMAVLCSGNSSDARKNIDINFTQAVDTKTSLNIDLTNATVTDAEKDVMALANNLYAHKVFDRIDADGLNSKSNVDRQTAWLDQRAIVAKRSVAENSFYNLVGQKSNGGAQSKTFLQQVIKNLGLNDTDAAKYVGDHPSYDAQMEVLTKKIYQDPAFYANLMDSPANVNRQYAAMQAIGLMQKRDIYETITRSEMLMSLLLEMEIAKYQDNIQNRAN